MLFLFLTIAPALARSPRVEAFFDRDTVLIGDRFGLEVRVTKDFMQVVDFPAFEGELAPGVELFDITPVDTLSTVGRRHTVSRRYRVSIWEPGRYAFAPFPVLYADKNVVDTLWSSDSLRIAVRDFGIDLSKDQPFDIKPPVAVPMKFGEISGYLALVVVVLSLLATAAWFFLRHRKNIPLLGGVRSALPPHVEAIRSLEALRNQKLSQNGRHKQYYSALTDILRTYIERRWAISAMEMTSLEISRALSVPPAASDVDQKRYRDLCDLLQTADLVKFAKFIPDDQTVDVDYFSAYYFVEETKSVVEGRPEESEKDI